MYYRDLETDAKAKAEHNTKMKQMAADRAKRRNSKASLTEQRTPK
jgi:hypothetical protein